MTERLNLSTPQAFFHEKVTSSIERQKISVSPDVEFYLVNLLCEFISPEKSNSIHRDLDIFNTPMAFLFTKALESSFEEQIKIFKTVGDTTLYISGYFQDYFNNKIFNLNYYMDVGAYAYQSVSHISRERLKDNHFAKVYQNLSEKFPTFVEIVADISDDLGIHKKTNLLNLYERWQINNSERLRKKLEEHGILPFRGSNNEN